MKGVLLACGSDNQCVFLGGNNRCSIYPTRPNPRVATEAVDEQRQSARETNHLPPLVCIEPSIDDALTGLADD